ncbi:MAG: ribosome maturation factor RimP [Pseudanabaenaceae cyanobacterium SKYGB_i_bin29]|nr:ribosome maturation factor RimP [Pseudanabaenaceae cyanobacterium SKYG29]MDW8422568.1 ribosome maturation factor RimP [Pseudanabaenaceae cyanobacterium SKYGB_i_bin29]
MTHPLIEPIANLARSLAPALGLEVVAVYVQTHCNPAVVRVDIAKPQEDVGLDDCERMSLALEAELDRLDLIPFSYNLEVSSPEIDQFLTTDRHFSAFRGFTIAVYAHTPYGGKREWIGQLIERTAEVIRLNQRGKVIAIPRSVVERVELH